MTTHATQKRDENTALPLIAHTSPHAAIAYRNGEPVTVNQFLQHATLLAKQLTGGAHVLNTCQDRYRFAVGLAATILSKRICLMPSTLVPETLNALQNIAPGYISLADDDVETLLAPNNANDKSRVNDESSANAESDASLDIPNIEPQQEIAWVFTSGSTGTPVPHPKTWASLVRNVRVEAKRLGMSDGRAHTIIGTVPAQHMYGFESTVLVALQSGNAFAAERPFYPADICQVIGSVPRPRLLVTTPLHLNYLLASDQQVPELDLVVSATAPLSENLARDTEQRLQVNLLEIYGCTETGQLATRRSTQSAEWQLFDDVQLSERDGQLWASGGHVEQPVAMQDVLEKTHDEYFLLHGRSSDLINIAGKRSSLAYLNHQLIGIPGVLDGAFFMPDEQDDDKLVRLMVFVVAPDLDANTLLQALRERVDAAFLPRPIIFVDALPRNATSKLPRDALVALAKQYAQQEN